MKIILVSIGTIQEYILYNIHNLLLFGNNDIRVITDRKFFPFFEQHMNTISSRFEAANIELIDCSELDDYHFNTKSNLDKHWRNGFWHFASLRLFYVYSYMKTYELTNCLHIENDVLCYENFDHFESKFVQNKVYVTFDADTRVIPGIMFIPNYQSFSPIIEKYQASKNDMENLSKFDETVLLPLPIFPAITHRQLTFPNKFTKLFDTFHCIFDAAAMGQYVGGVDKRNMPGDTRGFVNETCVIKYDDFSFFWMKVNNLYKPHILIHSEYIPIINLHIHSKDLQNFLADYPIEQKLIKLFDPEYVSRREGVSLDAAR